MSFRIISLCKRLLIYIAEILGYNSAEEFFEHVESIETGVGEFKALTNYENYFSGSAYDNWFSKYNVFHQHIITWFGHMKKIQGFEKLAEDFNSFITNGAEKREDYNKKYIDKILKQYKTFFDSLNKKPLTKEQRTAVVTDEDNNYINAGAGCGKTTTIIAKITYLVKKKKIKPKALLVLAFNRNAMELLKKRLADTGIKGVDVNTFHSFGSRIIRKVKGKAQDVLFTEKPRAREEYIQSKFHMLLSDNINYLRKAVNYFAFYLNEDKPESEFENLDELLKHNKSGDLRTLDGNYVKSLQEVKIGNFLYLNSINYEYEKRYIYDTADRDYRQYKPDFYLSDYDIWLEHFAMNKDSEGKLDSIFPGYMDGYKWKIETHEKYGTHLICTFSYQFHDGTIYDELNRMLEEANVLQVKRSKDSMLEDLENYYAVTISKFTVLLATFLSLIKSSGVNPKALLEEQKGLNNERNMAFLEIFIPIYKDYQKELRDKKSIDFDDMIALGTKYLNSRKYQCSYDYILIDEFQDIGVGRFNLVNAVKSQNPFIKTFCVGDDWQAIYRFAGGDVSILFDFEKYFGKHSKRLFLEESFRLSEKAAELSNNFIRKNSLQSKKTIISKRKSRKDPYKFKIKNSEDDISEILFWLERFDKAKIDKRNEFPGTPLRVSDVLIINRYKYGDIPARYMSLINKTEHLKYVNVRYSTIHSQKGGEADYVFIDDVNSGFLGFPNKMGEDSVLRMLLDHPEDFLDAEERRLFYVALTRAIFSTYILSVKDKASTFYEELDDSINKKEICDRCGGNMVVRKNNETENKFWGCTNFPICEHTRKLNVSYNTEDDDEYVFPY